VLVAYGSETGNAERVATHLCNLLDAAGLQSTLEAADDVEVRVGRICSDSGWIGGPAAST
jgi:flavodoxin